MGSLPLGRVHQWLRTNVALLIFGRNEWFQEPYLGFKIFAWARKIIVGFDFVHLYLEVRNNGLFKKH